MFPSTYSVIMSNDTSRRKLSTMRWRRVTAVEMERDDGRRRIIGSAEAERKHAHDDEDERRARICDPPPRRFLDRRTTECGNGKIKADGKYKRRGRGRVREGRAQSYNPLRGHTNKEHVLGQLCRKNQRRVKVEAAKMTLSVDMVAGRAVYSMEGEREGALVCLGNSWL